MSGLNSMRIRRIALALPNDGGDGGQSGDGAGTGGGAGSAGNSGAAGTGDGGKSADKAGADGGDDGGDDQFKTLDGKRSALADLRSERDKRQAAEKALAEHLEKQKSQEQRDAEAREREQTEAKKAILRASQYEAAEKAGLPLSWAKRISGDTPEAMLADAKEIADGLAKKDERDESGDHTHGAGAAGDGGAVGSDDGMTTLSGYYATSGKKK